MRCGVSHCLPLVAEVRPRLGHGDIFESSVTMSWLQRLRPRTKKASRFVSRHPGRAVGWRVSGGPDLDNPMSQLLISFRSWISSILI